MDLLTPGLSTFGLFKKIRTNKKWPLGLDPGGHHFVVSSCSINNTPDFVSEVVTYEVYPLVESNVTFALLRSLF